MKQLGVGALTLVVLGLLALFTWPQWRRFIASEAWRDVSPDRRYAMVVYRLPRLIGSPGGGSDAPGYVQLQDINGRVLHEAELEMIQLAQRVEWSPDEVWIPVVAGPWKLP